MPLKVCEIIDFANPFWNDFTRKSVAMSVTWFYWSFGVFSVAKNYDSQMVLRSTMYRKSMALYSYFGSRVYIHLESLWAAKKINLYQNFKIYNVKGFATLGYLTH
jgi:sulfur relay (sulfurtransferase) DsrF/TusC family protein